MFTKPQKKVYRTSSGDVRIGEMKIMRLANNRTLFAFEFNRHDVRQRHIIRHDNMADLIERLRTAYGIELLEAID